TPAHHDTATDDRTGVALHDAMPISSLTVNETTIIATRPRDQTNCLRTTANFGINATGTDLTYQWFKDSTPLPGATSNAFSITNVTATNAAIYNVVVSGACGIPITNS